MLNRLLLCCVAMIAVGLGGCAGSSATVVSSAGPGIREAQSAPAQGDRLRVAVADFDFRGDPVAGGGMADMLSSALFNSGRFIVLERARIEDVTAEQDLAASGRFDTSTVAPTGQLEGAELLVRASVTQFERECSGGSILLASTRESCVAVNLRIVDVRTGRIVNATTVEGTSRNSGVGFTYARSDLPIGLGAYRNTPMEAAIRNCIDTAVAYITTTKL